jgi:dethiobiotin synthetase
LSIEALKSRGIKIKGVIFNNAPNTDELILKNNIETIRKFTDIAVIENFGELLC